MNVMPDESPDLDEDQDGQRRAPRSRRFATEAIRYSGATSDRMTSASRMPMTRIAIGITVPRSRLEIELMS